MWNNLESSLVCPKYCDAAWIFLESKIKSLLNTLPIESTKSKIEIIKPKITEYDTLQYKINNLTTLSLFLDKYGKIIDEEEIANKIYELQFFMIPIVEKETINYYFVMIYIVYLMDFLYVFIYQL